MANLVIPGVFAGVGYLIGGPTGAQLGWMVGSAVQNGRQEIDQRSVGDLRVQTSSYGAPIPFVIGKQRLAGNIIWAADKTTYDIKNKTGKGGPTVVTTGYKISMLVGICAGPILGISRVWANGDLIVDSRTDLKKLPGELYLGDMTQLPDPTYQTAVGAGNAPAYRGLAYMAFTDYDLGPSGVVPQFSFEVIRGASL